MLNVTYRELASIPARNAALKNQLEEELSLQYHSLRIYDGTYTSKNVPYRIGNTTTTVQDEVEHYYDTWIDLRLIPSAPPTVTLPNPNTKFVSIPGRKDPIDMTTYLTGHPTYANRTGNWSFIADSDFVAQFSYGSNKGFMAFDKFMKDKIHGRIRKVVLRDDPTYFYAGELTYSGFQTGRGNSSVSITYNLYPFKKSIQSSMELWKFDDFDFEDGVIMYLKDMEVTGSREVIVYGGKERISPHISGSTGVLVDKWNGSSWIAYGQVPTANISNMSTTIVPGLVIDEGQNRLRFRTSGVSVGHVTIDYRRGLL